MNIRLTITEQDVIDSHESRSGKSCPTACAYRRQFLPSNELKLYVGLRVITVTANGLDHYYRMSDELVDAIDHWDDGGRFRTGTYEITPVTFAEFYSMLWIDHEDYGNGR